MYLKYNKIVTKTKQVLFSRNDKKGREITTNSTTLLNYHNNNQGTRIKNGGNNRTSNKNIIGRLPRKFLTNFLAITIRGRDKQVQIIGDCHEKQLKLFFSQWHNRTRQTSAIYGRLPQVKLRFTFAMTMHFLSPTILSSRENNKTFSFVVFVVIFHNKGLLL